MTDINTVNSAVGLLLQKLEKGCIGKTPCIHVHIGVLLLPDKLYVLSIYTRK